MLTVKNPKKTDWENMPLHEMFYGNSKDADFTLRIFNILLEKLKEGKCLDIYEKVVVPATERFIEIEIEGMDIDPKTLENLDYELQIAVANIKNDLLELTPKLKEINIKSNDDIKDFLYLDEDGCCLYPPKLTGKGAPSADKVTLEILLDQIDEELVKRNEK